jgi:DnaJ-class molecular chaperone
MDMDDVFNMFVSSDFPLDGNMTIDQLTDVILQNGLDITDFTKDELNQLLDMCSVPTGLDAHDLHKSHDPEHSLSFGKAGKCWYCHGSGVVWSGGANVKCSHCGGSGIGPE